MDPPRSEHLYPHEWSGAIPLTWVTALQPVVYQSQLTLAYEIWLLNFQELYKLVSITLGRLKWTNMEVFIPWKSGKYYNQNAANQQMPPAQLVANIYQPSLEWIEKKGARWCLWASDPVLRGLLLVFSLDEWLMFLWLSPCYLKTWLANQQYCHHQAAC